MRGKIIAYVAALLVAAPSIGMAKNCDCDQHDAGASGSGTCTLTESASYCQIKYTASSSGSRARANGFVISEMQDMADQFNDSRLPINETFRFLNRSEFQTISQQEFRDVLVNTIILTSPDREEAATLLDELDIDQSPSSSQVDRLYGQFIETGCVEDNISGFEGETRYLLLHARSDADGRCQR